MLRILGLPLGLIVGALAGIICGGILGTISRLGALCCVSQKNATLVGVGIGGLAAMVSAIIIGVWVSVSISVDRQYRSSFAWWVINRLLFLAAVGSLQSFGLYYLQDVLRIPDALSAVGTMMAVVGASTLLSALVSGHMADRIGRKPLVAMAGLGATCGTLVLMFSPNTAWVLVSGCIVGVATGIFFTTSWALGTDLVPPQEVGRYLGISNLAGAGAGIIGAGVGGPLVDFFNGQIAGLGYKVIFAMYGLCFLLSAVTLLGVRGVESTCTALSWGRAGISSRVHHPTL
jgi:MFS family permease